MMRYFTKKLWANINNCDEMIRIEADKQWQKNELMYNEEFKKTKKLLPKDFVSFFLSRQGFHDYIILDISIRNDKKHYSCEMKLKDDKETISLIISKLESFRVDVKNFDNCILGQMRWGYSEFEILSKNKIQLSVICDMDIEMQFVFETIQLVVL